MHFYITHKQLTNMYCFLIINNLSHAAKNYIKCIQYFIQLLKVENYIIVVYLFV